MFFEFDGAEFGGEERREGGEGGVVGHGEECPPTDGLITGEGEGDDRLAFGGDLCTSKE